MQEGQKLKRLLSKHWRLDSPMTVSCSSMFLMYPIVCAGGIDSDCRHEIAFVFGQLSTPHSIPSLLKVLKTDTESSMVRHEAAEALGGIVGERELLCCYIGTIVDVLL